MLKAAIAHAKEMQDWKAGHDAAEWLAKQAEDHVRWWDANVGVRKSAGNQRTGRDNADLRSLISAAQAEAETHISQQQVSRWRKQVKRPGYAERIFVAGYNKAWAEGAQRRADLQTGEMEWYTPAIYIEAARAVMGGIDLDPASCATAQEYIRAKKFYTAADDGLKQRWSGRVWLNPPYAGKLVAAFAERMATQWIAGALTSVIMLTNAYTETSWFHALAGNANAVCFTRGRIKFISPHGEKCAPTNGQSFFYFGDNLAGFREAFSEFGIIMVRP